MTWGPVASPGGTSAGLIRRRRLRVLKNDYKAILAAASLASKATDFLRSFSSQPVSEAAYPPPSASFYASVCARAISAMESPAAISPYWIALASDPLLIARLLQSLRMALFPDRTSLLEVSLSVGPQFDYRVLTLSE